ncbi:hypothetical protein RRG08_023925 [Elysia crispata]|uniref:Reverse transcriptase domain-containing protein n=1 Tax=Elysia crispata TaxID=231223 RepID=A0AAE0YNU9_9GAST|nr:hypothetical protein RRG08_023925 [Elysia crispata]
MDTFLDHTNSRLYTWKSPGDVAIRADKDIPEYTSIQRGIHQDCVLSLILFHIYTELILRQLEHLEGRSIAGRNISNLNDVDDTVLVSDTKKGSKEFGHSSKNRK